MLVKPKFCCRVCGQYESKITESRPDNKGEAVFRGRKCLHCGALYVTAEIITQLTGVPRGDRCSTVVSIRETP